MRNFVVYLYQQNETITKQQNINIMENLIIITSSSLTAIFMVVSYLRIGKN